MKGKYRYVWVTVVALLVFYIVFLPSPTPQFAIRKHLLFTFHPILAFSASITVRREGETYVVVDSDSPFFELKHGALGWRVKSANPAP
ncbi:hypothetical protein [Cohnella soli]|uniref:Uncharacterized protein n=1 Tax=Cohnella soli TaxID=425005 RepID=A0ABW0HZ69_9BACL